MSASRERDLADQSFLKIREALAAPGQRVVGLLPIGSTEPHGPHLPLRTDVIISVEAAPEGFRSGARHAGRYEGSLVMAAGPGLVDDASRRALPPVHISIGKKIKEGARTFLEAGGTLAYFGDPAAATSREGEETFEA